MTAATSVSQVLIVSSATPRLEAFPVGSSRGKNATTVVLVAVLHDRGHGLPPGPPIDPQGQPGARVEQLRLNDEAPPDNPSHGRRQLGSEAPDRSSLEKLKGEVRARDRGFGPCGPRSVPVEGLAK